ncbi:protease Do-like 9 isoform X2 [Brachypodium distachyon]|uniref:Uncharacterized protein n=1 Tax=Brachypodium distachyon TaxID=15368 RepID=A0A0Q3I861_BRADI|nr:protease Do-like 9 isoform X2 [Brachypodium distachyon]KQK01963.1 hypothetical protein BRADI_3g59542v3 [Brachypodium distachyon]|eukprot:XP_010236127.1 protease Do-like 9 isoform X2 [Brachypodium distachyon]
MDSSSSKGKRKRGRKSNKAAAADQRPPSPDAAPAPAPAAAGRRGRKPRRVVAPADSDSSRPSSPPRGEETKPVANGGDAVVGELGPGAWEEEAVRVVPSMDAVVKVFCVHTEPNFSLPWQRKRQYSSSSSGFIIGGRRVLTNAHSVEHFTQVKLKKRGSDTKYLATVLAIGTECDIGFPIIGIEWQKMENPDLRKAMGMKPDQKGVRVRRVEPTAPESGYLRPSDIILSFDGIDIANDGTVPFRHGERIGFSYLVSQKYTGEKAVVKVLRDSKVHEFRMKLATHKRLIAAHVKGRPPSYYIVAGFVFAAVSVPYLRSEYGKDYEYDAPVKLLVKHLHAMAESPDEQLVVVSQVLVADINIGYEEIVNTQVLAVNGQPVKNLKNLVTMVENCKDEFLKFDLEYDQIVVLKTKTAKAATKDILTTHCIPSAMSDDLKT